MPNRVLRAALQQWISVCCGPTETTDVVDRLLELGVRPPVLTLDNVDDVDQLPDGTAVVVGDLSKNGQVGTKCQHAILFAGEDQPYPLFLDGLAPPLPCTVVWVPIEGREHFTRIFAHRTADLLGLDKQALLRAYSEGDSS